jgi:NAD(P)-dependent dehydrogenase (short-subunit alcohol dehydrogenase family)
MDFEGKTALITGSAAIGGLGHATAKILAARGASVLITGRDARRGVDVVENLVQAGGTARFVEADLADADSVLRLADQTGAVDVLINNAGVVPFSLSAAQSTRSYDAAFAVNVRAPFFLTALIAPKMGANGGGSIVNITSPTAEQGNAGLAVYGATKAALESLTRTWAVEFAPVNVRVNAVSPGPMLTSKVIAVMGADAEGVGQVTPLARAGVPAEVAEVVAFVASDRASYMTGAIVAADGGRTAV